MFYPLQRGVVLCGVWETDVQVESSRPPRQTEQERGLMSDYLIHDRGRSGERPFTFLFPLSTGWCVTENSEG